MIDISTTDTATPALAHLLRTATDKRDLYSAIAETEEDLFRSHIQEQARVRHKSASNLGATPTGELERASNTPEGTATATGAEISIRPAHLFARAFRDVTILPTNGKKFLTIPVHKEAYGKTAGDFPSLRFYRTGKAAVLARQIDGGFALNETLFLLVARVRQKQDRTLLPSDEDILKAAELAAEDVMLKNDEEGKA